MKEIVVIILIVICTTSCMASKTVEETLDNNEISQDRKAIIKEKPCWVERSPEVCNDFISDHVGHLYYKAAIVDQLEEGEITESQETLLKTSLASEFFAMLESYIESDFLSITECKGPDEEKNCKEMIKEEINIISGAALGKYSGVYKLDDIHLLDVFETPLPNGEFEIYGLAKINRYEFKNRMDEITERILSGFNKEKSIQKPEKKDGFDNLISDELILTSGPDCDKYEIDWIDFEKDTNKVDIIVDKIDSMLKSLEEGIYNDNRVIETISEIRKTNTKLNEDEISKKEIETQNQLNNIISCSEMYAGDVSANHFKEEVSLLEKYNSNLEDLNEFNNIVTTWKNILSQNRQYRSEIQKMEQIYEERLKLLSHTFLVLTTAKSPDYTVNARLMADYFDVSAENVLKAEANHYVESQLKINDDFAESILKDKYNVSIEKSSSDGIFFMPRSGERALIQKYRKIDKSRNMGSVQDSINKFSDEKYVESKIILGNEDIKLQATNEGQIICRNCKDLKNKNYHLINRLLADNGFEAEGQNGKIIRFIDDVIMENARMVRRYIELKEEYLFLKGKKEQKISDNINNIEGNNGLIQKIKKIILSFPNSKILESTPTLKRQIEIEKVLEVFKGQILKKHDDISNEIREHRKMRDIIVFTVIDKTEEIDIDLIQKNIEQKYKRLILKSCRGEFSSRLEAKNSKFEKSYETKFRETPIVKEFFVPVIRIKAIEQSNSKHYSIAILIKNRCKTVDDLYRYSNYTREVYDVDKNSWWKIKNKNRIPTFRKNQNSKHSNPIYDDYIEFCEGYNDFKNTYSGSPLIVNWPNLICIDKLEFNENDQILTDHMNKEQWKISKPNNIYQLISDIRESEWNIVSMEKMRKLFSTVLNDKTYDNGILKMGISNKKYWTNNRTSKNRRSVIGIINNNINESVQKNSEPAFGLLYREIADY